MMQSHYFHVVMHFWGGTVLKIIPGCCLQEIFPRWDLKVSCNLFNERNYQIPVKLSTLLLFAFSVWFQDNKDFEYNAFWQRYISDVKSLLNSNLLKTAFKIDPAGCITTGRQGLHQSPTMTDKQRRLNVQFDGLPDDFHTPLKPVETTGCLEVRKSVQKRMVCFGKW